VRVLLTALPIVPDLRAAASAGIAVGVTRIIYGQAPVVTRSIMPLTW